MLSAARCAWLEFVAASRLEAALVPIVGFLLLILFLVFQDRISRVPRRICQIVIIVFILGGLGDIVYESLSPQECGAAPGAPNVGRRFGH